MNNHISIFKSNKFPIFSTLLLAVFVALLPNTAISQQSQPEDTLKFYYGAYAGYNLNFHIANFKALATDCPTCVPENYGFNVGGGLAFGGLFEYILYKGGQRTPMRIGARLGYSDVGANFVQEEQFANIASPNDAEPVRGITEHNLEASISQINFTPYFSYSFTDNLVGNIGLNAGYMMTHKFNQWEELTYPDYATFAENNSKIRNQFNDQDIPSPNTLQFGVNVGIGYEFPIGKFARLVPELQYNLNFNSVSEVDWHTSSLRIGLAAKFPVVSPAYREPELHFQRDTNIEYKLGIDQPEVVLLSSQRVAQNGDTLVTETYVKYMPKASELASGLSYYVMDNGVRKSVSNIVIEEFETTEYFPFLPIVFFPDGSSDLSQTKMHQIPTSDISTFKEKDLRQSNVVQLYYDMLNILGERMTQRTRSNITIRGYSSEVGNDLTNKQIGIERANAIKNYLVNVWKINANRIKVEHSTATTRHTPADKSYNDVVEENRRAQIYSDDLALLTPVVLSRIEKISNPPEVNFELTGNSQASLTNYDFTLSQSGNNIRQYSGDVNQQQLKTTQLWNVMEAPVPEFETPIIATLNLSDNTGQKSTSTQDLKVSQITIKSKAALAVDSLNIRIERYSLCLFDFDQASLTPLHTRILDDVKKSIQPNSELSIDGYADRTGDTQYNIDLAGRRCESVRHFINPSNSIKTDVEAVGNQRLLFDNSTPEGRAFCRTVRLEIRTPNTK